MRHLFRMIQRTWGQIKDFIAEFSLSSGLETTDDRLLQYFNRGLRELMNEGEWPGVVDQWYFRTDPLEDATLVLPSKFERLLGITLDGVPKELRSPWFEFCTYGPGSVYNEELDSQGNTLAARVNWSGWIVDKGESVTRTTLPVDGGPWKIRVYATYDESTDGVNPEILIRGIDENGDEIRSGVVQGSTIIDYITGEYMAINSAVAYTESLNEYASLTSIMKPETRKAVVIKAWNGTTEIDLSRLDWDETNPTYRRYFLPELYQTTTGERDRIVRARCRLRFKEIKEDSDIIPISNELALAEICIAQYKRQVNSLEEYMAHKQTAIDIMRKEATAFLGKTKTPAITFQRGWGIMADTPLVR